MTTLFGSLDQAMAAKNDEKTLLRCSQTYYKGESRHVSISARTAISTMWTESSWAFRENIDNVNLRFILSMVSYTTDESWIVRSSDSGNGETKSS